MPIVRERVRMMRLVVREANLDPRLRDLFEQLGEPIVEFALAIEATRGNGDQMTTPVTPTNAMNVVYQHQAEAAAWLVERRDLAARRETINTMLRIAFLAFLVLTVLVYWLH
jgi:hypothetical protein